MAIPKNSGDSRNSWSSKIFRVIYAEHEGNGVVRTMDMGKGERGHEGSWRCSELLIQK